MAVNETGRTQTLNLQIYRFSQSRYVDAIRWLPSLSAFARYIVISLFDFDDSSTSSASSIEIHTLSSEHDADQPSLSLLSTFPSLSRTSSLQASRSTSHHRPLIGFSTFSGSFHLLSPGYSGELGAENHLFLRDEAFHCGPITCVDGLDGEFVTVGEEGRVNLVSVNGSSGLSSRRVFDSNGVVSYTVAKWASPKEFATGGIGFSLQWWDQRKPGGPALQFKNNWPRNSTSGIVHSIDIHPSRKHTCLAGGSSGSVFAWDLRWQQQPVVLMGAGPIGKRSQSISESDVWEVQYDCHAQNLNTGGVSSSQMLPAMVCSEDGILAVLDQGVDPVDLLAEPCAINTFDIDLQSHSIVCGLEWESVAVLTRQ